jgi:hypothetical protein
MAEKVNMTTLDELEARMQKLLEIRLLKILPGFNPEHRLIQRLADAMYTNLRQQVDGSKLAPNVYVVLAHPYTLTAWHQEPHQLEALSDALKEVGNEAGWIFYSRPGITTSADPGMVPGDVRITASFSGENLPITQDVSVGGKSVQTPPVIPENAFLILGGTRIIPLTESVINIGRRLDNQVVIDDPRVSRNHAQLRVIKGRFVIFDLESTGGLFLNGQRVSQTVLYPGDVISLAGVTLVFGQDIPSAREAAQARQVFQVSADRATVFLRKDKDELK